MYFDKAEKMSLIGSKLVRMKSFQDSEETIHSAEIHDSSYERTACFHWTIYSATNFLENLEKWFCKLRIFFLVNHFSQNQKKYGFIV